MTDPNTPNDPLTPPPAGQAPVTPPPAAAPQAPAAPQGAPVPPPAAAYPPPAQVPPVGYGAAPAAPGAPLSEAQDKQMAMWAHLGGILMILPSLIIYLVFKDRGSFTKQEAREALNFQITLLMGGIVIWIVVSIVAGSMATAAVLSGNIGLLGATSAISAIGYIPWVVSIIFSIIGALKAKDGIAYRYPFALRLVK